MTATSINLNNKTVKAEVAPRTHLADFIREHSGLTGTHLGCEHGICGACTVEIDGEIARSCITFAVACDGAAVRTIEGFDDDALMARLRHAFTEEHALQCGFCTPGMLIAARDLIRRGTAKSEHDIRVAMSGNLCRCTGYAGIVSAIMRVIGEDDASDAFKGYEVPSAFRLGPVGSLTPAASVPVVPSLLEPENKKPAKAAPSPALHVSRPRRPTIAVTTDAPREDRGLTHLSQSFVLPHPRDAVWAKMRDIGELIRCLPGAQLDGPVDSSGAFNGGMTVVFGPIAPSFKGGGCFVVSDTDYSGEIQGKGQDERGGARATGEMRFRLTGESGGHTRVEVAIAYRLTGALAQFGRPSIVRGVVTEVGAAFATNLDHALAGEEGATATLKKLTAGALFAAIMKAWLLRLYAFFKPRG